MNPAVGRRRDDRGAAARLLGLGARRGFWGYRASLGLTGAGLALVLWLLPVSGWAGSAQTLPRGVFNAEVASYFALVGPPVFYWEGLGGTGGRQVTVGRLPRLSAAGQAFSRVDPASADGNLAEVDLDYNVSASLLVPSLYYGLTDWLSVGFAWPIYLRAATEIEHLTVGTGSLGYNARYPEDPQNARPVVTASDPAAVVGTEGVLRLAEEYFEYAPVRDWDDGGPGDLYLGSRLRLFEHPWVRLAGQLTVVVPVGQTDDPDHLVDWGLGDGQTDLSFSVLFDLCAIDNLLLSLELTYTVQLPDSERMRVYPFADFPFAPKTRKPGVYALLGEEMEVDRDLGDVIFFGLSARYTVLDWWVLGAGYSFDHRFGDTYEGPQGRTLDALAEGTSYHRHNVSGGVGLSTLVPFQKKRFPAPLYAHLLLSKTFSNDDDQASLMATVQLGLYFKF